MTSLTYHIHETDEYKTFYIECKMEDGTFAGKDSDGNDVFIYTDGTIEICERPGNRHRRSHNKHKIFTGHLVTNMSLNPYQYIHAGEIRDKRSHSMCARPFFPYGKIY